MSFYNYSSTSKWGFPGGSDSLKFRKPAFDPWARKIPWRRAQQPAPVFLLGESPGQRNLGGYLAWKIPWTEKPGGRQSMGLRRVGHDRVTSLSLFTFMHWRRKWQPTPVFLPGESQGRGSLLGCHLWGRTESDTTEVT